MFGYGYGDDSVTLSRECEAIQVPSGERMLLPAGTKATITQALGGTYSLITDQGYMVRVAGKDADALGKEPTGIITVTEPPANEEEAEERVWEQLRTVYDPEIPVNIADLGLVYKCDVTPLGEGQYKVAIDMTLTAPGCGMGDVLKAEVEQKLEDLPGLKDVDVQLVLDPPWDLTMMPEAARLQLGML
jgi:probable FeS assembly SUF system protein SufT